MSAILKQHVLAAARALRVLPLLDAWRFAQAKKKFAAENEKFLKAHPDFEQPPLWWMHDMYRHTSFERYWRTGKHTAGVISEKINAHVDAKAPRVADWGCGLGRVIRHLPDRFERFGFDYNEDAIDWDAEHIKGATFYKNDLSPPLPVENGAFDALYALSVFTHLSAEGHEKWIAEVNRVLAPGGVFIGAFHMRPEPGQLLAGEQARFDAGEIVIRGGVKEGSRTYTAHHPESYLRGSLLKDFDILEPPFELYSQSIFVVRKRAGH